MNKLLISAVAACTALAMPVFALAPAAAKEAADSAMAAHAMAATMVCRPANAAEKATAMTTEGNAPIVCKSMHPGAMMHGEGGPKLTKAMTPSQVDAAWRAYISSMMIVPGGTGGG